MRDIIEIKFTDTARQALSRYSVREDDGVPPEEAWGAEPFTVSWNDGLPVLGFDGVNLCYLTTKRGHAFLNFEDVAPQKIRNVLLWRMENLIEQAKKHKRMMESENNVIFHGFLNSFPVIDKFLGKATVPQVISALRVMKNENPFLDFRVEGNSITLRAVNPASGEGVDLYVVERGSFIKPVQGVKGVNLSLMDASRFLNGIKTQLSNQVETRPEEVIAKVLERDTEENYNYSQDASDDIETWGSDEIELDDGFKISKVRPKLYALSCGETQLCTFNTSVGVSVIGVSLDVKRTKMASAASFCRFISGAVRQKKEERLSEKIKNHDEWVNRIESEIAHTDFGY